MPKKALITGITGQDSSYLAELLLEKGYEGYEVHGIIRRSSSFNTARLDHLYQDPHVSDRRLILHYGDLCDGSNISRIIERIRPERAVLSHLGNDLDYATLAARLPDGVEPAYDGMILET